MATKNQETLGRRIARLRLQHAMTQERLANIANVSAQAVSKWENDQSYPDILLLPVLATTFGVSVDELLGVEGTAPEPVQATKPMTMPMEESEQAPEPQPEPEPEPQCEPELQPEPVSAPVGEADLQEAATHLRIHVVRGGADAVNLAIPLVAARLVSNVAGYVPDRIFEGVDIAGLARSVQNANRGTLIDVNDGADHVIITLE